MEQIVDKRFVFYINPSWRRKANHTPFLNPWWGNLYDKNSVLPKLMFDTYSFNTNYYNITENIEIADMVLAPYPHTWLLKNDKLLLNECMQTAEKAKIPILIDGLSDVEHPVEGKNSYVLRYGGYRFLSEKRRIQIPLFVDDLLERYNKGKFLIRKKVGNKPIIGFVGWARLSFSQYLRTTLKELPIRIRSIIDIRYYALTKGIIWRKRVIRILRKSSKIILFLKLRSSFSANPKTAEDDVIKLQKEMTKIILESDYCLDVKGDANNSARLFEILSLGRIPVIIDTQRNFPFNDIIDYSSFSLIIDFHDLHHLADRISEFHANVSSERFETMQKNARETYLRYFRIDAMMRYIIEELRLKIANDQYN